MISLLYPQHSEKESCPSHKLEKIENGSFELLAYVKITLITPHLLLDFGSKVRALETADKFIYLTSQKTDLKTML